MELATKLSKGLKMTTKSKEKSAPAKIIKDLPNEGTQGSVEQPTNVVIETNAENIPEIVEEPLRVVDDAVIGSNNENIGESLNNVINEAHDEDAQQKAEE